ncbi:MAG: HAD family hydrolase [Ignavibacteriaceae bacterium]|nr:HAD family hydrolase [Ignavibacteriaceae bacterium]
MLLSKILKDIKLVVFDLDGTLLSDDGKIGEETKSLVKELKKKDVRFSFASGRLHSAIVKFTEELDIDMPVISLDGALIKNSRDNNVLYESFISKSHVKKSLKLSDMYLVNVALCHADAIYFTDQNSIIPQITDKFGARFKEVKSYDEYLDNTLEVFFAGDNRSAVTFLRDKMSFPFTFGCSSSFYRSHSKENIYYLEIRKSGSTKGNALKRLLKYLNLSENEAAVVGDWYNDIPMFKTNSFKVAVNNAVAELKRNADFVTRRTNNEDAAGEFLSLILKYKKGN